MEDWCFDKLKYIVNTSCRFVTPALGSLWGNPHGEGPGWTWLVAATTEGSGITSARLWWWQMEGAQRGWKVCRGEDARTHTHIHTQEVLVRTLRLLNHFPAGSSHPTFIQSNAA